MTDDTNVEKNQEETIDAVETTETTEAVETTDEELSAPEKQPVSDEKARAREFYRKRQERKIEEAAAQSIAQQKEDLQRQLDNDEIPHDEVMSDVLLEKDQQLREYQLKDLVNENPLYAPHKEAISHAMHEQRYANLSLEEVASLVAAKSVLELQEQARKVDALSTTQGTSARGMSNEVDYRNMSGDELERRIAAAKFRS